MLLTREREIEKRSRVGAKNIHSPEDDVQVPRVIQNQFTSHKAHHTMASSSAQHHRNNHRRRMITPSLPTMLLMAALCNVRDGGAAAAMMPRPPSIICDARTVLVSQRRRHRPDDGCFVAPLSFGPRAAVWGGGGRSSYSTSRPPYSSSSSSSSRIGGSARRRDDDYDNYDGDDDDFADGDGYDDDRYGRYDDGDARPRGGVNRGGGGRRRRRHPPPADDLGTPPLTGSSPDDTSLSIPSPFGRGDAGLRLPPSVSAALLAGVFVLGIGTGVTVDSQINTNPRDLASRDAVDKNAPNPTLCTTYGASAMAFDQRVFVSFNPFNVYVAQADVKPACVLRPANVVPILKERKLLNDDEIRGCKMNMNTWAFVGDLNDQPQLSCVYKSEDAQNEFLDDPKRGIGEDYLDDDYQRAMMMKKDVTKMKTGKMVKDTLTEGQMRSILEMGEKTMVGGGAGGGA